MAEHSNIQWTQATWNPWYGCTKVSPGCKNCYMYREMRRYGRDPFVTERSRTKFDEPLKWQKMLAQGKPAPRVVFTCSWSDFFIEDADGWRDEAWDIIQRCPDLTFLILTKRLERIHILRNALPFGHSNAWPNAWLGVSCEDQNAADRRIPVLLQAPTARRFVSLGPLLGPITLNELPIFTDNETLLASALCWTVTGADENGDAPPPVPPLDWVIVEGESGDDARPTDPRWIRTIRDQCIAANVPFFFKHWGEWGPLPADRKDWVLRKDGRASIGHFDDKGNFWYRDAAGTSAMNRAGRDKTGRLLDGREWNGFPPRVHEQIALGGR